MTAKALHDFYFDELKWCGCGEPVGVLLFLADVLETKLRWAKVPWNETDPEVDARYEELLGKPYESMLSLSYLYTLDGHGLTDHGTGIWWAWVSDLGKAVLTAIRTYDLEEVFECPPPDWEDDDALRVTE